MWKWETEKEAKGIVVIVHNMLEHTGRYAYVITKLRREGYHVIMGDLKGQGQTSVYIEDMLINLKNTMNKCLNGYLLQKNITYQYLR